MSSFTIMIVDDDMELCNILKKEIEKHFDNGPIIAYDGDEAIEKFSRHRPDVVLLDVMMPKRNGWETCQFIRAIETEDQNRKKTYVIMISCLDPWQNEAQAKEYGADEAWNKPISRLFLIRRLQEIQNQRATA